MKHLVQNHIFLKHLFGIITSMKATSIKFLIICFVFLFGCFNLVLADTPIQDQLTKIEKELWGFSYSDQTDAIRLERIEKQVFGVVNLKVPTDKRIDKISKSLGIETYKEAKSSLSDLYAQERTGEGVQYPQIDQLESTLLGATYKNENIYKRLERLEKKVFGAVQSGDLDKRTEALKNHTRVADEYKKEQQAPNRKSDYSYNSNDEDIRIQLSVIENMVFGMDFSQEPNPLRLNRLENRIFQRGFMDDDDATRVARLQAAANAKRTAKYYDNNKFQKFTSTGLQAASFILMILALIL